MSGQRFVRRVDATQPLDLSYRRRQFHRKTDVGLVGSGRFGSDDPPRSCPGLVTCKGRQVYLTPRPRDFGVLRSLGMRRKVVLGLE